MHNSQLTVRVYLCVFNILVNPKILRVIIVEPVLRANVHGSHFEQRFIHFYDCIWLILLNLSGYLSLNDE